MLSVRSGVRLQELGTVEVSSQLGIRSNQASRTEGGTDLSTDKILPETAFDLDLTELITGMPNRLRFIHRFSSFRVMHQESVAEHSFYVAFYSLWIAEWVTRNGTAHRNPDIARMLTNALLHDNEEALTGDILHAFKYESPETARALKAAAEREASNFFGSFIKSRIEGWVARWSAAKSDNLEGFIIRFADALSCLGYVLQELEYANKPIIQYVGKFREYMERFHDPDYDFIRPLADEALDIARRELG